MNVESLGKRSIYALFSKHAVSLWELCPQTFTGTPFLDPAGGHSSPRPLNLPTPWKNHAGAHVCNLRRKILACSNWTYNSLTPLRDLVKLNNSKFRSCIRMDPDVFDELFLKGWAVNSINNTKFRWEAGQITGVVCYIMLMRKAGAWPPTPVAAWKCSGSPVTK